MPLIEIPKNLRAFAEMLPKTVEMADKANAYMQQESEIQVRLARMREQEAAGAKAVAAMTAKADEISKDAQTLVAVAKLDADKILAKAHAEVNALRDEAKKSQEAIAAKVAEAEAKADAAVKAEEIARKAVEAAKAEEEAVKARITKIKADAAAALA